MDFHKIISLRREIFSVLFPGNPLQITGLDAIMNPYKMRKIL